MRYGEVILSYTQLEFYANILFAAYQTYVVHLL